MGKDPQLKIDIDENVAFQLEVRGIAAEDVKYVITHSETKESVLASRFVCRGKTEAGTELNVQYLQHDGSPNCLVLGAWKEEKGIWEKRGK